MTANAPYVCATTPFLDEPAQLLREARESVPPEFAYYQYPAPLALYKTESALRDVGRLAAQTLQAEWWLQIDADERLRHGEQLSALLDLFARAYPLPRLEEDGSWTLCPYKLVRLPCELVVGCDHFRWNDSPQVWRLSGYPLPDMSTWRAWKLPYLEHRHSRRPRVERLGASEGILEPRPPDALQWPLPAIALEAR